MHCRAEPPSPWRAAILFVCREKRRICLVILTTQGITAAGQGVRIWHAARNAASSRPLLLSPNKRITRCVYSSPIIKVLPLKRQRCRATTLSTLRVQDCDTVIDAARVSWSKSSTYACHHRPEASKVPCSLAKSICSGFVASRSLHLPCFCAAAFLL